MPGINDPANPGEAREENYASHPSGVNPRKQEPVLRANTLAAAVGLLLALGVITQTEADLLIEVAAFIPPLATLAAALYARARVYAREVRN